MPAHRIRLAAALLHAGAALAADAFPEAIDAGPWLTGLAPGRVTVSWETARRAATRIEYAVAGQPARVKAADNAAFTHSSTLDRLPPGTECRYRVFAGSQATPFFRFTTPPEGAEPFRFAKYGDSGGDPEVHARVAAAIAAHRPAFVVHTGDFVPQGDKGRRWADLFFLPARPLLAQCPLYPTPGDNDRRSMESYCEHFHLPPDRTWYTWTHGGAAFFALDSCASLEPESPQIRWLAEALADCRARWRIALVHHPLYSSGRHGSHDGVRRRLAPLFFKHGIDLILSGDDHIYERTHPLRLAGQGALVQIVSGGGGQPLYPVTPRPWTAHAASTHNFCIFDVEPDRLTLAAFDDAGKPIDRAVLTKEGDARRFGTVLAAEAAEVIAYCKRFDKFRFPIVPGQPAAHAFRFTMKNGLDRPLSGRIAWTATNPCWSVVPAEQAIAIAPGGELAVAFQARYTPGGPDSSPEPVPQALVASGGLAATVPAFILRREPPRKR